MASGQPYSARSPTQPSQSFNPYSPTQKTRPFYGNEGYQQPPPPQTPPSYPGPHPHTRSPHFSQAPSSMSKTLPALNGAGLVHHDSSPQYQSNSISPGYHLQRPYPAQYGNPPPLSYASAPPSHAHPQSRSEALSVSPTRERHTPSILHGDSHENFVPRSALSSTSRPGSRDLNYAKPEDDRARTTLPPAKQPPARSSDPMSFANILSEPAAPPRPLSPPLPSPKPALPPTQPRLDVVKAEPRPDEPMQIDTRSPPSAPALPEPVEPLPPSAKASITSKVNSDIAEAATTRKSLTNKEHNKVLRAIDNIEHHNLSDVEDASFDDLRKEYMQRKEKRTLDIENEDSERRKVRLLHLLQSW